MKPKKSLGQHFLTAPGTSEKIVRLARLKRGDPVLEIGPGRGILTRAILKTGAHLVAVEKDRELVRELRTRFKGEVEVIEADILDFDLSSLPAHSIPYKVLANLPYNISTEVIFHLLERTDLFSDLFLMVQREVAERLVARPGSKDYGILSVFTQLFSENRIVMRLPPGAFTPPPKVHSAVVEFRISEGCRYSIHHLPTFEAVVRAAFGQRRKMIGNALEKGLSNFSEEEIHAALKAAHVPPTARAEAVPIEGFVRIANELLRDSGHVIHNLESRKS